MLRRFVTQWSRTLDVEFAPRTESSRALVRCELDVTLGDSYALTSAAGTIEIRAGTAQSLQWALLTLEQLIVPLDVGDEDVEVPELTIVDKPRFVWRGAHLDVARHFFDVDSVCRFIDLAARHKLNIVHLHLNDDQGWRLEIPQWPRLTIVGSIRHSSPRGHDSDGVADHVEHRGFYSAQDVAAIVQFARERFVTIVPEIDMPGHVQAVLAAYPEFANVQSPVAVRERWGISRHVLNLEEATLSFADDVLRYVGELFPGPYVHIGGDECPSDEWATSERAHERMRELNIASLDQVQSLFTDRFAATVRSLPVVERGDTNESRRRAIAWDEVLDAGVHSDVIIGAWRHSSEGARAARLGHHVVMAPMQFTYFDWPQSDDAREPVALTKPPWPTTLEKAYRFSVIPPGLEEQFHERILGAQAQHWSEYISTLEHLEYMAYPRLCAFSETVWGTSESFDAFRERLVVHLRRLDALGVHYRALDES